MYLKEKKESSYIVGGQHKQNHFAQFKNFTFKNNI